ncbi:MAG TPA: glycosyltransferase family 4 protein [Pyrinomonadaceae bacterium]|nr:glycosyltransferase family 4 protein [Pyrinomonadaceae bacterium]
MLAAFLIIGSGILTFLGVEVFRRWSLKRELLDIPNERSSHARPTPRGGGLAIVVVVLAAYVVVAWFLQGEFSWGFFLGAAFVALISWLDDLYSITFVWRFLVHCLAAALVIANLGYFNEITLLTSSGTLTFGLFGILLTGLWIVWVINAYNFMDGIDGIAGLQAVVAFTGWAAAAWLMGAEAIALFAGAGAAASAGFLIHNWEPAKIFMGDVGSAFIGFTLAVLPLMVAWAVPMSAPDMPILAIAFIWPFVFDTVITFFRRLFRGERVWTAHRTHLYQRMIINGRSHKNVSKIYGGLSSIIIVAAFAAFFTELPWKYAVYTAMAVTLAIPLFLANKNVDPSHQK